jgi:AcrR family transcriptional regulator
MRTTKAQSDALARSIREAAARRFAQDGYAAVAVDDVASDAGATRGAVYHHFGSKEGLFRAVLQAAHLEVGAAVAAAAEEVADPWDGFVVGCETFVRACLNDRFRRILLVDGPAVVGMAAWREGDAAGSGRHLAEAVAELQTLGLIDSRVGPALVPMLSGALNEAALWAAEAEDPATAVADILLVLRIWLDSFRSETGQLRHQPGSRTGRT